MLKFNFISVRSDVLRAIEDNVLQLYETALNTVYVKPFCITVVSRRFIHTVSQIKINIKWK